jgi:hypothetical protein
VRRRSTEQHEGSFRSLLERGVSDGCRWTDKRPTSRYAKARSFFQKAPFVAPEPPTTKGKTRQRPSIVLVWRGEAREDLFAPRGEK